MSGSGLELRPGDLTTMEEMVEGSMVVIGRVEERRAQTSDKQLHSTTESITPADADGREEWSDASKLLFQSGYYKVLKEMALSGQIQLYNIRGVCWKLFLGCLPEEPSQWEEASCKSREHFNQIKKKHLMDPHSIGVSLDVTLNNPLSQAENSPWHQFFLDNELRQVVEQDVVRTFPDVQFFKQPSIQATMLDLLFCYAKEHPEVSYRQGMHELLAPILFVLHSEMRDVHNDPSLAPVLRVVMDPQYIEHDAFAIFTELMENMQPWYMFTALEADEARVRAQNSGKMIFDPRRHKPFDRDSTAPTSAITRKLDVIQHLLLKKADPVLYQHLTQLAIPAQTYGIRWIRLLFGREFPLPTVLELWDALFADGPSLSLMDYMCVAMLIHIREVLIEGDYTICMQHLMHFPLVYEVNYLVQWALHIRSPSSYPAPRVWTYRPARDAQLAATQRLRPQPRLPNASSTSQTSGSGAVLSRASKAGVLAKQMLSSARQLPKALSKQVAAKSEVTNTTREPSPRPQPTPLPQQNPLRAKRRAQSETQEQEMKHNPKSHPRSSGSSHLLERLTNRLDDLETKCQYCGSKMESLLSALQEEVTELTDLPPSAENTIYLSLAELKQVRDLLLNKIPFSGEMAEDLEEEGSTKQTTPTNKEEDESSPHLLPPDHEPNRTGATDRSSPEQGEEAEPNRTGATDRSSPERGEEAEQTLLPGAEKTDFHPLLASGEAPPGHKLPERGREGVEEGKVWEGVPEEEWVHLPSTYSN